jgi:hypothetical protein
MFNENGMLIYLNVQVSLFFGIFEVFLLDFWGIARTWFWWCGALRMRVR